MNKVLALFISACATVVCSYGISPLLCEPRIGDRLSAEQMAGRPMIDNAAGIVNVSRMTVTGITELGIWNPVPSDTLSRLYVTSGSELKKIRGAAGDMYISHENRPGYIRRFPSGMPFGMVAENKVNATLVSDGRIDGITDYSSSGRYTLTLRDYIIISHDDDTLKNAVCVKTSVCDTLHFSDAEPSMHKGVYSEWYAPGYRYPVLSCAIDSIFDMERNLSDASEKWQRIIREMQEESIKDDPLNEEIRKAIADEENRQRTALPIQSDERCENTPPFLRWNADKTEIIVTETFSDEAFMEVILCDIHGRLYYSSKGEGPDQIYHISTSGLIPGIYILYIGREEEPYVYQFRK